MPSRLDFLPPSRQGAEWANMLSVTITCMRISFVLAHACALLCMYTSPGISLIMRIARILGRRDDVMVHGRVVDLDS